MGDFPPQESAGGSRCTSSAAHHKHFRRAHKCHWRVGVRHAELSGLIAIGAHQENMVTRFGRRLGRRHVDWLARRPPDRSRDR